LRPSRQCNLSAHPDGGDSCPIHEHDGIFNFFKRGDRAIGVKCEHGGVEQHPTGIWQRSATVSAAISRAKGKSNKAYKTKGGPMRALLVGVVSAMET